MATIYLYIDDDRVKDAAEKVQGFEQADLKVLTNQHKGTWESQMKFIKEHESSFCYYFFHLILILMIHKK